MNRICRTCLRSIPSDIPFFQLNGEEASAIADQILRQLKLCIPDVRINIVKDPILCSPCLKDLSLAYKFKTKCLETEKHILDYVLTEDTNISFVDISLVFKRLRGSSVNPLKGKIHSENFSTITSHKKHKRKRQDGIETHGKNIEEGFKSKRKFPNLLSCNSINIVGPLSKLIPKDQINCTLINGIKKNADMYPQFTDSTVLHDCIEVLDDSDTDIFSNANGFAEENSVSSFVYSEDCRNLDIDSYQTTVDNSARDLQLEEEKNSNIDLESSSNLVCYKDCNDKENGLIVSSKTDCVKVHDELVNCVENLPILTSIVDNDGDISQTSTKTEQKTSNVTVSISDTSSNVTNSIDGMITDSPRTIDSFSDTNVFIETIPATNAHLLDIPCGISKSTDIVPVKQEVVEPTEDEIRAIRVKDEIVIKDECEFQRYQDAFQIPFVDNIANNDSQNRKEVITEGLHIQLTSWEQFESSVSTLNRLSESLNCEEVLNNSSNFVKSGCYSCAVCGYSCNSEVVLITHTKIHVGEKYNKLTGFRGFPNKEDSFCVPCKYAKFYSLHL